MKPYAVAATLIKDEEFSKDIVTCLKLMMCENKDEASGRFIREMKKEKPEHHIFNGPLVADCSMKESEVTDEQRD